MDFNGDSEGNFSVLSFKEHMNKNVDIDGVKCGYHMVTVAFFIQGDDFPVSELSSFTL